MSVLVDQPIWNYRDEKWSHLVSDTSYDELHRFANRVGLRRIGFQGDHYDIPQRLLSRAHAAGAIHTESRELVRRLRGAGLRKPRGAPSWEPLVQLGANATTHDLALAISAVAEQGAAAAELAEQVERLWSTLGGPIHRVFALHRPGEVAVAFDTDHQIEIVSNGPAEVWTTDTANYRAVDLLLSHARAQQPDLAD